MTQSILVPGRSCAVLADSPRRSSTPLSNCQPSIRIERFAWRQAS
jgi:hypothetical protein